MHIVFWGFKVVVGKDEFVQKSFIIEKREIGVEE